MQLDPLIDSQFPSVTEKRAYSGELSLQIVSGEDHKKWRQLMQRYHYLGCPPQIGAQLCYVVKMAGDWVALLGWGAAALKNPPREKLLGWSEQRKYERLHLVVNNVRFLMLPWVKQPHLASRILAANLRRLSADWQSIYGHRVLLAETFVDRSRFLGTCYRASNWRYVGDTKGFSRNGPSYRENNKPKAVFVYPLHHRAVERLTQQNAIAHCMPRRIEMLTVEQLPKFGSDSLFEAFKLVKDPRKARGTRHPLTAILAICTTAVACGAKSLEAIAQWAREQPKEVLQKLGSTREKPPSEPTIRRMLKVTGVNLDQVSSEWFASYTNLKGKAVAIDGKTLRGSGHGQESARHLVSVVTHEQGKVLAQTSVPDKTNEISCIAEVVAGLDLRGAVVTADALLTQREIARHLVEDKGAAYVFVAKGNQPSLENDIASVNWDAIPPSAPND